MRKNINLIFNRIFNYSGSRTQTRELRSVFIDFEEYIKNVFNSSEEYERKQLAATIITLNDPVAPSNESDFFIPRHIQEMIGQELILKHKK